MLEREYSDLEEVWKAEKADLQGTSAASRSRSRRAAGAGAARARGLRADERDPVRHAFRSWKSSSGRRRRRPRPRASPCCGQGDRGGDRQVVSRWTGIPVSKMLEGEREKLLQMEAQIARAWSARPRRSRWCPTHPPFARRPVRSEPAVRFVPVPRPDRRGQDRAVQGAGRVPVRHRSDAMVRIDMSEFMEKHAVARLIGARPRATWATRKAAT